jgi:tetratricopeptide (TPR) repeat protein
MHTTSNLNLDPQKETLSPSQTAIERAEAFLEDIQRQIVRALAGLVDRIKPAKSRPEPRQALSEQMLADANAALGNGYLQRGQYELAIEALNNALRHDPEFAKAYFLLGMAKSCRGEHAAAIGHFSQAIGLRSDKASYYFCRGRAYEALRQPHHAMDDYSRVLLLEPEHHGAICAHRHLEEIYRPTQM